MVNIGVLFNSIHFKDETFSCRNFIIKILNHSIISDHNENLTFDFKNINYGLANSHLEKYTNL